MSSTRGATTSASCRKERFTPRGVGTDRPAFGIAIPVVDEGVTDGVKDGSARARRLPARLRTPAANECDDRFCSLVQCRLQNVSKTAADLRGLVQSSAEVRSPLNLLHPRCKSTNWHASSPCWKFRLLKIRVPY